MENYKSLQILVNNVLKKLITGFVLTNYVSIIPKLVSWS